MEFLGKIGIDPKLFVAQIVNFGLLLWFLDRFVYRYVVSRIEKDEENMDLSKAEEDKLNEEKKSLREETEMESAKNKEKAVRIIKEAEDVAKKIVERAKGEAEVEKQMVIAQIRSRLAETNNVENRK